MMNFGNSPYFEYFRFEANSYSQRISYYENHIKDINRLQNDIRVEVDIDYALCLFEVGKYERFLQKVDNLIETVIIENIYEIQGINIYNDLLFKKAACLYHINQLLACKAITIQLLRIDPYHKAGLALHLVCHSKLNTDFTTSVKATAITSFIIVVSITLTKIFIIEPFFYQHIDFFLQLRILFIIIGIACFFIIAIYNEYIIKKEIGTQVPTYYSSFISRLLNFYKKK